MIQADMGKVDSHVDCYLFALCRGLGNPRETELWFQKMLKAGYEPNIESFNLVLQAFSNAGDTEGALQWYDIASTTNLNPNRESAHLVASAYDAAGDRELARLWRHKRSKPPTHS